MIETIDPARPDVTAWMDDGRGSNAGSAMASSKFAATSTGGDIGTSDD